MDHKRFALRLHRCANRFGAAQDIGWQDIAADLHEMADEIDPPQEPKEPTLADLLNAVDGYTIVEGKADQGGHCAEVRTISGRHKLGEVEVTSHGGVVFRIHKDCVGFTLDSETIQVLSSYTAK